MEDRLPDCELGILSHLWEILFYGVEADPLWIETVSFHAWGCLSDFTQDIYMSVVGL